MIKVAIIGVGNCASSLIQGKYFYETNPDVIGLITKTIGKYSVNDIEFVAAFDIDKRKVGLDLSKAIYSKPNNSYSFYDVPYLNIPVLKGNQFDGIAGNMIDTFISDDQQTPVDIAEELVKVNADVLINFLPVGSLVATQYYADEAIKAKVAFINAIPEFICSNKHWETKFISSGLVCAGDDIKSQIGATILNRTLTYLIYDRGCVIENMYQLNVGGNSDFKNMVDENRLYSKRISKTNAVLSTISSESITPRVKIGPSEYIPHLEDKKICYINIKGKQFGQLPFELDLKLSVEDSPNSAGVMLDVIRLVKVAKDAGLKGNIPAINAFAFKNPSVQIREDVASEKLKDFLSIYATNK